MERTLIITVKENSYTVKYPTVGQIIDIETAKVSLAKGQYGAMVESSMVMAFNALECIDAMSHIQVLVPELIRDLKVNRLQDLDPLDFMDIVKSYKEDMLPWIQGWQSEFKEAFNKIDVKK